ncbi:uncharacterized protein mpp4b isoform X2 [Fundulus heteroclitus]|uniref:uncharacterized protein mpp4b isoform X2 n=1 Tax=Fundulus heteroclitus TaxID=8078 RepID=UPI00165B5D06|nr:uncharacterized protein mpp4b isoform X2 [Fundulus heteroclitus]
MRQAVEAQVMSPPFELGEQGLRQILSDVIQEVRRSISQDIDGADILHSLLTASWLQSLLKVYECLQRYLTDSPAPILDYASGLSLQLLMDIRSLPCCSEEAKELYRLLRQPHMQALLSAHDTVAQKDYEPVLPPMPEELANEEEATRIVCLVKNKQPLLCELSAASHARPRRCSSGMGSSWSVHNEETSAPQMLRRCSCCDTQRTCGRPAEPPCRPAGLRAHLAPGHQVCCSRKMIGCRACSTDLLLEQRLNQSVPSVYSPHGFDDPAEELGGASRTAPFTGAPHPSFLGGPCCFDKGPYLQPGLPHRLRAQSPCIRTAPPSPMQHGRVLEETPVQLAKQESLDELRTTVQLAASSMESSSKDIRVLGERMVAATERMTETVQSMVLLTQVVDRLQTLLTTARNDINTVKISDAEQCSSVTQQSRCSSSSSAGSLEAPSTSKDPPPLPASRHGSPPGRVRTKPSRPGDLGVSKGPVTNGELDELAKAASNAKACRCNQRRKKKKRKKQS